MRLTLLALTAFVLFLSTLVGTPVIPDLLERVDILLLTTALPALVALFTRETLAGPNSLIPQFPNPPRAES